MTRITTGCMALISGLALAALTSAASATVIISEDFEDADFQGWLANGNEFTNPNGNPGTCLAVPFLDFNGMQLRNETNPAVLGDLSRYGDSIQFSFDARVFQLYDQVGNELNPDWFSLTLELVNYGDPGTGAPYSSVYTTIFGLPQIAEGWRHYEFTIPMGENLPIGWGGTGDEDPETFMPRLPAGVTYGDILRNVDEFRVSTYEPGFFYGLNFWEFGWDNVNVSVVPAPSTVFAMGSLGVLSIRRRRQH